MKRVETYIRLTKGVLAMKEKGKFFDNLRSLPDGLYNLVAEFVYDNRSSLQNRYYWGVVIPACMKGLKDSQGEYYSKDDAHYILQLKYNFKEYVDKDTGEVDRIPAGTHDLKTIPFSEYTENCRNWIALHFGIETPDPE